MIRSLVFLLLLTSSLLAMAKGGQGYYYIAGTALNAEKKPLANDSIQVSFKGKKWYVRTDAEGKYEIEIEWISACPSGVSNAQQKRQNKKLNPPIDISYRDHKMQLPNEWSKYASFSKPKEETTWKKDLVFG